MDFLVVEEVDKNKNMLIQMTVIEQRVSAGYFLRRSSPHLYQIFAFDNQTHIKFRSRSLAAFDKVQLLAVLC